MYQLRCSPAAVFAVPDGPITVAVVGCGGTGSHVADILARLMIHRRMRGESGVSVLLIDGDTVAERNLGRQRFVPRDLGHNKAQALAARLNAAYGLAIHAVPAMATAAMLGSLAPGFRHVGILVGCVDRADSRQQLAHVLGSSQWRIWIDCGNEAHAGQVVVGTTTRRAALVGCLRLRGVATALPALPLVFPDALSQEHTVPEASCADAVADGRQDFAINAAVAQVAAGYVSDLVTERRLTTFWTDVDIRARSMRTQPITVRAVARATGMAPRTLLSRRVSCPPERKGPQP